MRNCPFSEVYQYSRYARASPQNVVNTISQGSKVVQLVLPEAQGEKLSGKETGGSTRRWNHRRGIRIINQRRSLNIARPSSG